MKKFLIALSFLLFSTATLSAPSAITSCGSYGSGYYVVDANLSSSGDCLTLSGNVDLIIPWDRTITGPGGNALSRGIVHSGGRLRTSGGGKITNFRYGAQLDGTDSELHHLDLCANTYIGVVINGTNNAVRHSTICDIAGVTDEAYAIGVQCGEGSGCTAEHNRFSEIYRQPTATPSMVGEGLPFNCSSSMSGSGCHFAYNYAENTEFQEHTYGGFAGSGAPSSWVRNHFINFSICFAGGPTATTAADYLDNTCERRISNEVGDLGISMNFGTRTGNQVLGYEQPFAGSASVIGNAFSYPWLLKAEAPPDPPDPPDPPPGNGCTLIPQNVGTTITDTTGSAAGPMSNLGAARDGVTSQSASAGSSGPSSSHVVAWIGVQWPTARAVTKAKIYPSNDQGSCSNGSQRELQLWKNACGVVSPGSDYLGGSGTISDSNAPYEFKFTGFSGSALCWRTICTDTISQHYVAEIEFYEGSCP